MNEVNLPIESAPLIGVAWEVGNKLTVFPTNRSTSSAQGNNFGFFKKNSCKLAKTSWETTLYSPVFRKLVNESSHTFFTLQSLSQEDTVSGNEHLIKISRQYRSVIRDCQELVDKHIDNGEYESQEMLEDLQNQSELLYKLELIWNLVEIFNIENHTAGVILPHLLHWITIHFPQADEKTRLILEECPENPEQHSEYWNAIELLLTQGRRDDAQNLLRLHAGFGESNTSEILSSFDELVRKMPLFNSQMSVVDFNLRWNHWQKEASTRLSEGDFASIPQLVQLVSLMTGDEDAFMNFASRCETWYQWMVAKLFLTFPSVKKHEILFHAEQAINTFGGLETMSSLDSILLSTIEDDITQLMNELASSLDNFWFPAHLLDLLNHSIMGNMNDGNDETQPGRGLREFFLLDYATCLMTHNSLWQVGALYLDYCPTQGKKRFECLIQRIALTSEKKANKIIHMALQRGLNNVASGICKEMGVKALREDQIGCAMTWALRSQDVYFTTFLADKILNAYCEAGEFNTGDLLDNLGSSMILSDRLTFLAKYQEFHKLCEQNEFKAAADLLHSLIWSRLAPKYFWVTLFIDAIPFLSSSGNDEMIWFTSEQTFEIMHCLQELLKDATLPKKQRVLLEEHEAHLRIQLAQNLAKSLMDENDSSKTDLM